MSHGIFDQAMCDRLNQAMYDRARREREEKLGRSLVKKESIMTKTSNTELNMEKTDPLFERRLELISNLTPPPLSGEQKRAMEHNRMLNEQKYGKGNEFNYMFEEGEDED